MDSASYEDAIKEFALVLEQAPNNYTALNATGVAKLRLGDAEGSLEYFTKAINSDTTVYKAFFNRGNALQALERDNEAMLDYDYAIQIQPNVVDLYLSRGGLLFKYDEFDRALFDFEFALNISPESPVVLLNKGKAELRINNPDDAIYSFKKALEYKSDYGEAYYWLGLAELAQDNVMQGCNYLFSAQSLNVDGVEELISQNCMQ